MKEGGPGLAASQSHPKSREMTSLGSVPVAPPPLSFTPPLPISPLFLLPLRSHSYPILVSPSLPNPTLIFAPLSYLLSCLPFPLDPLPHLSFLSLPPLLLGPLIHLLTPLLPLLLPSSPSLPSPPSSILHLYLTHSCSSSSTFLFLSPPLTHFCPPPSLLFPPSFTFPSSHSLFTSLLLSLTLPPISPSP